MIEIRSLNQSKLSIHKPPPSNSATSGCRYCLKCKEYRRLLDQLQKKYDEIKKSYQEVLTNLKLGTTTDLKSSGRFRFSQETVNQFKTHFLLGRTAESENQLAKSLIKCKEVGEDFTISFSDQEKIFSVYMKDLREIVRLTLTNICTRNVQQKNTWQTTFFNLMEAIYQTRFGEESFKEISKVSKQLIEDFPAAQSAKLDVSKMTIPEKIDGELKLSSVFKPASYYLSQSSPADIEHRMIHGEEFPLPSEFKVLELAVQYAKDCYKVFEAEMSGILDKNCGGKFFKANVKLFERASWKLYDYASEKKIPTFESVGDLLRCRAAFTDLEGLSKAYSMISSKYKIIRLKNKLNTPLYNVTFNFIFEEIIAEMQLIYGTVESELENHQLYEIHRCQNIKQLYTVAQGWGSHGGLTEDDYAKGRFIDTRPLRDGQIDKKALTPFFIPIKSSENIKAPVKSQLRLLRTIEYGKTDSTGQAWHVGANSENHSLLLSFFKKESNQAIIINYNEDFITSIENEAGSKMTIQSSTETSSEKFGRVELLSVRKIIGTFQEISYRILSLNFTMIDGSTAHFGSSQSAKSVSFEIIIPDGYHLVGLSGHQYIPLLDSQRLLTPQTSSNSKLLSLTKQPSSLLSLYCWISPLQPFVMLEKGDSYEGEFDSEGLKKFGHGVYNYKESKLCYIGDWKNDKREGKGYLYEYGGNLKYSGDWENDMMNGFGEFVASTVKKEHYKGEWLNNKMHGTGTYLYHNGARYEGEWRNNMREGLGTLTHNDGEIYKGQWLDDLKHGDGEIFYKNGDHYIGKFAKDCKEGFGCLVYFDEASLETKKYEGEWLMNKKTGKTKQYFLRNGTYEVEYEGSFLDDNFHGENGIYNYRNGDRFEGTFNKGQAAPGRKNRRYITNGDVYEGEFDINLNMSGKGVMKTPFGSFEGDYVNNMIWNGKGIAYTERRKRLMYYGDFVNGEYHGNGVEYFYEKETYILKNGDHYEGVFENGKRKMAQCLFYDKRRDEKYHELHLRTDSDIQEIINSGLDDLKAKNYKTLDCIDINQELNREDFLKIVENIPGLYNIRLSLHKWMDSNFFKVLDKFTSITSLYVKVDHYIGEKFGLFINLSKFITKISDLREFKLETDYSYSVKVSSQITEILESLTQHKNLEILTLKIGEEISPSREFDRSLFDLLSITSSHLKAINLSLGIVSKFFEEGLKNYFMNPSTQTNLQVLNLDIRSSNEFYDNGTEVSVMKSVESLKMLKHLSLSINKDYPQPIQSLVPILTSLENLEYLQISNVKCFYEDESKKLDSMFELPSLKCLDVYCSRLPGSSEDKKGIFSLLNIQKLVMKFDSELDSEQTKQFGLSLSNLLNLEELELSFERFSEVTLKNLNYAMCTLPNLKSLKMEISSTTEPAVYKLISKINKNKSMLSFSLDVNISRSLPEFNFTRIKSSILKNLYIKLQMPSINTINISDNELASLKNFTFETKISKITAINVKGNNCPQLEELNLFVQGNRGSKNGTTTEAQRNNFPRLKELKIHHFIDCTNTITSFITSILTDSPNLKNLEVKISSDKIQEFVLKNLHLDHLENLEILILTKELSQLNISNCKIQSLHTFKFHYSGGFDQTDLMICDNLLPSLRNLECVLDGICSSKMQYEKLQTQINQIYSLEKVILHIQEREKHAEYKFENWENPNLRELDFELDGHQTASVSFINVSLKKLEKIRISSNKNLAGLYSERIHFTNLKDAKLELKSLNSEHYRQICSFLAQIPSISNLYLKQEGQMIDEDTIAVINQLETLSKLNSLNLIWPCLSEGQTLKQSFKSIEVLFTILSKLAYLKELSLDIAGLPILEGDFTINKFCSSSISDVMINLSNKSSDKICITECDLPNLMNLRINITEFTEIQSFILSENKLPLLNTLEIRVSRCKNLKNLIINDNEIRNLKISDISFENTNLESVDKLTDTLKRFDQLESCKLHIKDAFDLQEFSLKDWENKNLIDLEISLKDCKKLQNLEFDGWNFSSLKTMKIDLNPNESLNKITIDNMKLPKLLIFDIRIYSNNYENLTKELKNSIASSLMLQELSLVFNRSHGLFELYPDPLLEIIQSFVSLKYLRFSALEADLFNHENLLLLGTSLSNINNLQNINFTLSKTSLGAESIHKFIEKWRKNENIKALMLNLISNTNITNLSFLDELETFIKESKRINTLELSIESEIDQQKMSNFSRKIQEIVEFTDRSV